MSKKKRLLNKKKQEEQINNQPKDRSPVVHQRNKVEHFLLSSGIHGYTFQVKSNAEWFALKWS